MGHMRLVCPWDSPGKNTGVGCHGTEPASLMSPALAARFFTTSVSWEARLPMQETKRDAGLIPGSGRSPGGGHSYPLQYFCLGDPMDTGAWRATVRRVPKIWTRLKWLSTHTHTHTHMWVHAFLPIMKKSFITQPPSFSCQSKKARTELLECVKRF